MKKALFLVAVIAGTSLFVGCSKSEEDANVPPAGATLGKDGKPLSAAELQNVPKAAGAFDGVPGGPGAMKKGGAPR